MLQEMNLPSKLFHVGCSIPVEDIPIDKSFLNCVVASSCACASSDHTPCTMAGRLSSCKPCKSTLITIRSKVYYRLQEALVVPQDRGCFRKARHSPSAASSAYSNLTRQRQPRCQPYAFSGDFHPFCPFEAARCCLHAFCGPRRDQYLHANKLCSVEIKLKQGGELSAE